MKIKENSFVAIDYTLTLDSGEEVDKSEPDQPLGFVWSAGQVIPGMEKQLAGKEIGWESEFTVEAEDGYGQANADLFQKVPRSNFPEEAEFKPGLAYEAQTAEGVLTFTIKSLDEQEVTIDLNHPLCGERLHFKVKVVEVREASEEELAALDESCDCSQSECGGCGAN